MKTSPTKVTRKERFSPYCPVCGTCGYIGCCGVRDFLEKHVKGKTNCDSEAQMIKEICDLMEREEEEIYGSIPLPKTPPRR